MFYFFFLNCIKRSYFNVDLNNFVHKCLKCKWNLLYLHTKSLTVSESYAFYLLLVRFVCLFVHLIWNLSDKRVSHILLLRINSTKLLHIDIFFYEKRAALIYILTFQTWWMNFVDRPKDDSSSNISIEIFKNLIGENIRKHLKIWFFFSKYHTFWAI